MLSWEFSSDALHILRLAITFHANFLCNTMQNVTLSHSYFINTLETIEMA